jgi:ribosomal protein L37E
MVACRITEEGTSVDEIKIRCPNCGRENDKEADICVYCGYPLFDTNQHVETKALDNADFEENIPKWGPSRVTARLDLIIEINENSKETLTFDTTGLQRMVLGRVDPETNQAPEINLTPFGAQDKGVSRQHAAILLKDGSLHIMDLGSYNGTFLNGQRLIANQPRVLRDGDSVRLGYLVFDVAFEQT